MDLLSDIFTPKTHLHLVIWNRFNDSDHEGAMNILLNLMTSEHSDKILPMIRPLGRPLDTYQSYTNDNVFQGNDIRNIGITSIVSGSRTAHCEIWFQVADESNEAFKETLKQEFQIISSVCFFWESANPIWQPIGNDIYSCDYARSRNRSQDSFLCSFCDNRIAQLLKLIWYRATEELIKFMQSQNNSFCTINPISDKSIVKDILIEICSDIDLKNFGLFEDSTILDPTEFGASHLAVFAMNSITNRYLEECFGGRIATRPSQMPNRTSFLSLFN